MDISVTSTDKGVRNQALYELALLDTLPDAEFNDLAALASEICDTPISLISLVDSQRQWFKAAIGLATSEASATLSFCAHATQQQGLFVIADARNDERFKDNPFVLGSPYIRFYAGMPLYVGDNVPIGTLCVVDTLPRSLFPGQVRALAILSHQVKVRTELLCEREKRLREFTSQLESSNESLIGASQKVGELSVRVEQMQLQHMKDERELQRRSELDSLKNEYVAMVSHELRSPLTSVKGAVEIMSAGLVGPVSEKGAKLLNIAVTNLDRVLRLVDDVLNLERIASGTASLQMQKCSLEDLVQQAVETMEPIAQGLGVKLAANTETNVWGPFFHGDADKILQVLINLLSNAIKFSPREAEVVLDIGESTDELRVRIADEGRGIPEDQLERVFERFRQVQQDDARRLGGTGLGLAICRAIVEQHGGKIWAERNAIRGTSFLLTLSRVPPSL